MAAVLLPPQHASLTHILHHTHTLQSTRMLTRTHTPQHKHTLEHADIPLYTYTPGHIDTIKNTDKSHALTHIATHTYYNTNTYC